MTRLQVTRWRRRSPVTRRTRAPGPGSGRAWPSPGMRGRCCCTRSSPGRRRDGAGAGRSRQDTALLTAVSACFALGAATVEQFKHLAAADAGPLAGLGALPALRTLRPKLAAIADRTDPVAVQAAFAAAMLAADPVTSGVYYVDDHFIPYAGAKPVAKGWNNKRGRGKEAARTPTSPRTTAARSASCPASRPG